MVEVEAEGVQVPKIGAGIYTITITAQSESMSLRANGELYAGGKAQSRSV